MEKGVQNKRTSISINLTLIILSLIWIFPVLFLFIGSMKTRQEYNLTSFWQLPSKISWAENIKYIADYSEIFQSLANSILYGLSGSIFSITIAAFAAYGLAKLNIKRKMFWFFLIYSGTIFPFQLYLIPVFSAYQTLGLYDTRIGLILFYITICIPFSMFVLRNHFMNISNEIVEAAQIDGASKLRIFACILIPMSKAPLSVLFITQFAWCFNDLMFSLTFIKTNEMKGVMATISTFIVNTPALLVACAFVSVPIILLYTVLSENFDKGISYQSK